MIRLTVFVHNLTAQFEELSTNTQHIFRRIQMETLKINTHLGTLNLKKRGKKGTWQINIYFKNIEGDNHYRQSTGTNQLELAKAKAMNMITTEYSNRLAGIKIQRDMKPQQYLTEIHIPWLITQIDKPNDKKPSKFMSRRKVYADINVHNKWFVPFLKGKTWEHLETPRFGRDLTSHLRDHIADATICSYLGFMNRMFRQAEIDGYLKVNMLQGVPALSQEGYTDVVNKRKENSYAIATDEMIQELLNYSQKKSKSFTRKDLNRTYIQVYAFFRILVDTGMRPYTKSPFTWNMINDTGEMIRIHRHEKGGDYIAQGGTLTREALNDLRELYFSEGTNVEQYNHLPIIHHIKGGNSYNGIPVEGRSQIFRFCDTLGKVLRECKWHLKEDYQGRKYRLHSIRKWHINKSIQGGEDRFQIADRVGHKYEVLHKFYLEKDAPQQMKADLGLQNPVMIKSNDAEAEETYS